MSRVIEVQVPDIGDAKETLVIEVSVCAGDVIAVDDTIVVLETDKASMDVPSPQAGKVVELGVKEGDTVGMGAVLLVLDVECAETSAQAGSAAPLVPRETAEPAESVSHQANGVVADKPVYASPSIRSFARNLGVPIAEVLGTGHKGRIGKKDVESFIKRKLVSEAAPDRTALMTGLPAWPKVDFGKFGPVTRQALTRIGKIAGPALTRNSLLIPHVCNFDKADVTDLEKFRKTLNTEAKQDDARLSMLAFTVKAAVSALKAYPTFNSSLENEELIIKNYWNIGVAVDTAEGLVVPVIKDADAKGLREIATEMTRLAQVAREGKLVSTDMQGATFTISSLGGIGGTGFTPIINAPEVAILGMTRAEIQPVWNGESFEPRLIQPLSVSWDHRVVDGVLAARFLVHIAKSLSDFRRICI